MWSLSHWKANEYKGVFLKVPTKNADWMPVVVEAGFSPHLADASHVLFSLWLPETPNVLPAGPSHNLAITAYVLNAEGHVLCVKERHGPSAGQGWKLPQGKVEAQEDVSGAAIREVHEETGVMAEFVKICSILETQSVPIPVYRGFSSLLCICLLRCMDPHPVIKCQEGEIEDAAWLPLEELKQQPLFVSQGIWLDMLNAAHETSKSRIDGIHLKTVPLQTRAGTTNVWHTMSSPPVA
jgi:8-oxo-dGTP pyrophosphatase MutT (NUDIX family)